MEKQKTASRSEVGEAVLTGVKNEGTGAEGENAVLEDGKASETASKEDEVSNAQNENSDEQEEIIEEKTSEEEIAGFDIKTGEKDLSNFVLHHNYRSASGVIGLILSAAAIIYLIVGFGAMDNLMRGALLVIGLLFTVVNPLMLVSKAKRQARTNKSFQVPIHYSMTATYLVLTQDEQWVQIPWKNVCKVTDTGRSIVVYVSRIRAFIWPKAQLGDKRELVMSVLRKKVAPAKIKISIKK